MDIPVAPQASATAGIKTQKFATFFAADVDVAVGVLHLKTRPEHLIPNQPGAGRTAGSFFSVLACHVRVLPHLGTDSAKQHTTLKQSQAADLLPDAQLLGDVETKQVDELGP